LPIAERPLAGYNVTEALFDPSRKVELQSLTKQYQDQQAKTAAGATPTATTVLGATGTPNAVPGAAGTPAATVTSSGSNTLTPEQQLEAEKSKLAQDKAAKELYYYKEQADLKKKGMDEAQAQETAKLTADYNTAIAAQQERMAKDASNAGVILGTQGAARSARAQQAVSAMNQKNSDLYNEMVSSKNRDL
jgi:hypothetical protein